MPGTNLTRVEAEERAALLEVTSYDVVLDLTASPRSFSTTSTITFSCSSPGSATFVDFIGESVRSVTLNGTALDAAGLFGDSRIAVPDLAAENVLRIEATGLLTNTGEGLHRFVDPVDDEAYLYTQFEVADSRRMFPVFEQPDLKARFAFTVTAPAHWQIVSNSPTPEPEPGSDGAATWRFAPTERISSYITALIAGPYDSVSDERDLPRRRGAAAHPLPQVADPSPRRREPLRADQGGLRLLRGRVRPGLPVREVRPDLHARVQRRRDGERGRGDVQRGLRVPVQGHRGHPASAGRSRSCTSSRTCGSATS